MITISWWGLGLGAGATPGRVGEQQADPAAVMAVRGGPQRRQCRRELPDSVQDRRLLRRATRHERHATTSGN